MLHCNKTDTSRLHIFCLSIDASSRALDTLTDVLGNFLGNFCKIMRINADRLQEDGSLSFQDVLDQSLHQCGMRGKAELHRFWKSNVSDYMKQLNGEVESQMAEYEALMVRSVPYIRLEYVVTIISL